MPTAQQAAVAQKDAIAYIPRLNPTNLFLILFTASVFGAVLEAVFMFVVWGELQNRSGLLWGQFSLVWGCGAVVMTLCLRRAAEKGPGVVFLAGAVLGSGFEFLCSWLQERCFGVSFWDYSHLPFSIGGRVNLIFALFWGAVSFFWMFLFLPALGKRLDRLPRRPAAGIALLLAVLLLADIAVSAAALWRMAERSRDIPASGTVELYLDERFPDQILYAHYPSMKPVP